MRSCPARLLLRGHCQRGRVQGTRRSEGGSGKEPGEPAPMGGQRPEQALTLGCPGPPGQSHELAPQCGALLILPLQGGHEWLPRKEPSPAWRTSGPGSPLPTPAPPPPDRELPAARSEDGRSPGPSALQRRERIRRVPNVTPPSLQTTQQQAVICCPAECLPLAGASSVQLQLYKERRESQAGGWTGGGRECPAFSAGPSLQRGPSQPRWAWAA